MAASVLNTSIAVFAQVFSKLTGEKSVANRESSDRTNDGDTRSSGLTLRVSKAAPKNDLAFCLA